MHQTISGLRTSRLRAGLLVVAALVASPACVAESSPTDVPLADEAPPRLEAVDAAAALASIDDALVRLLPALGEAAATERLHAALAGMSTALAAGDPAYPKTVTAARIALAAHDGVRGADLAELDAIRLALEAAASSH